MLPSDWFYSSLIAGSGELKPVWRAIKPNIGGAIKSNLLSLLVEPACLLAKKGRSRNFSSTYMGLAFNSTSSVVNIISKIIIIIIFTISVEWWEIFSIFPRELSFTRPSVPSLLLTSSMYVRSLKRAKCGRRVIEKNRGASRSGMPAATQKSERIYKKKCSLCEQDV